MLGWVLPCLLYCVSPANLDPIANLIGVGGQTILTHDTGKLRIYWSAISEGEALFEAAARKTAELKFRSVLREVVSHTTPIAFPFPSVALNLESVDTLVEEQREYFIDTLKRLADTVQYELTATWADEEQADLATPVKGSEYLERRLKSEARIAAIDAKLKAVTEGIVREWRQHQERRAYLWFALIARADRDRFAAALRSAGPSEGVRLRLSGPWPPTEFTKSGEGAAVGGKS